MARRPHLAGRTPCQPHQPTAQRTRLWSRLWLDTPRQAHAALWRTALDRSTRHLVRHTRGTAAAGAGWLALARDAAERHDHLQQRDAQASEPTPATVRRWALTARLFE